MIGSANRKNREIEKFGTSGKLENRDIREIEKFGISRHSENRDIREIEKFGTWISSGIREFGILG